MPFGLDKCNKITIIKGKITQTNSIVLDNKETIKELENNAAYKYLGINENKNLCKKAIKSKMKQEYFTRIIFFIKSDLNSKNTMTAINTYALPALSYGFVVLDWSITNLNIIDRETRNILKKNHAIQNTSNTLRLYIPRKNGGRGLLNVTQ